MKNKIRTILLSAFAIFIHQTVVAQSENFKPNIIVIFMDDMGYGDLGCYGHPRIKTPNLDAMAQRGVRFTSFYAGASVCTPSRAAILTGKYPIRNATRNFGPESETGLSTQESLISERLQEAGYRTAAIGKWHLGHLPEYLPTSRGFDSFYGLPYSNDMILPWCPWLTEGDKLHVYRNERKLKEIGKNQDDLTLQYHQEAMSFIKESGDDPFFLYLAHSMPHLPISTSSEFRGKSRAGLYGDVIETIDHTVGELFKLLNERGIADNTLVIFTSDNGPWLNLPERMMQDGVEPWHSGSPGPLRGSKMTSFEGGFRVPAIMTWPNVIEPNQVNYDIVSTIDFYPTFLAAGGLTDKVGNKIDGINLLPMLKGEATSPRESFVYSIGSTIAAYREDNWKLIKTEKGYELFNLDTDPSERYDVGDSNEEVVNRLLASMKKVSQDTGGQMPFIPE